MHLGAPPRLTCVDEVMARVERNFATRPPEEQASMLRNTWCGACGEADLGLRSPREYEECGRVYVEGQCKKCGQHIRSEILENDAR